METFDEVLGSIKPEIEDINRKRKEILKRFQTSKDLLSEELRQTDLYQSDLLHCLELEPCDAVRSVRIASTLKFNSRKRRGIKNEIDKFNSMIDRLKNNVDVPTKIITTKTKKYSYRVANPNNIFETRKLK